VAPFPNSMQSPRMPGSSRGEDEADLNRERTAPPLSPPPPSSPSSSSGLLRRAWAWFSLLVLLFVLMPAYPGSSQPSDVYFEVQRRRMVEEQILRRGVRQPAVLDAMRKVPRHRFVPSAYQARAYTDHPLPIGRNQTISQPYIVARMTELLDLTPSSRVLEIGTGSGYHAAVLAQVAREVYTIEIVEDLGREARERLASLGYRNVHVRIGDGYRGWPEEAPFDAIILTAAPAELPQPLLDQLKVGGKMVLPQGSGEIQDLLVITRTEGSLERQRIAAVRFVPMTGEAEKKKD